jgi:hypothetical protein
MHASYIILNFLGATLKKTRPGVLACACNPSYPGGIGRRIEVPGWLGMGVEVKQELILKKKNLKQKRLVA